MSKWRVSNSARNVVSSRSTSVFGQGERAADDGGDAVDFRRNERADDHPRAFGREREVMAAQEEWFHGGDWGG